MNYLSPGVYVKEIDNSAIVPTVSNSVAFFGGNFTKGPIEQPFVVTNKAELEFYFGQPTDLNYNEWFQCSKFLDYANQLVISRGFTQDSGIYSLTSATLQTGNTAIGNFGTGSTDFTVNSNSNLYVGTVFTFDSISGGNPSIVYVVTNIAKSTSTQGAWFITFERKITISNTSSLGGFSSDVENGDTLMIWEEHQNAGIDAYQNAPALDALIPDTVKDSYNQDFNLYKNDQDFDFKIDAGISFDDGVKLKFIARTAGQVNNQIEISIVNSYDFIDYEDPNSPISTGTRAEAFAGESVVNFFDYTPKDEEIGIIIRKGDLTETYIASFDKDAVDGNNKSMYVETIINDNSELVYVVDNLSVGITTIQVAIGLDDLTQQPRIESFNTYTMSFIDVDSQGIKKDAYLGGGAENNPVIGTLATTGGESPLISVGDIKVAYFEVEDKELYEIDIVIGNEIDEGDAAISLAIDRSDCIAFVGGLYGDIVGKKAAVATQNLVDYILRNASAPERTMFASFFGNYHRVFDNFSKKYRWINCAGDMAGLRANTNTNQASWWASAGLRRGVIRNIDKISFSPSLPQRDALYKNNINPIVQFPGEGNLCWGQKTLLNFSSSFDRVNVRGLFNTIERAMAKAARSSVFEFNDPFTRNAILAMFNPYLSGVKAGRGISDFLVICDTTNNTPDVISRNELVVDIYIKPAFSAEFINITFNNVGTRSFSSVIGAWN